MSGRLAHVVHRFGTTPRHKRAAATWEYVYAQGVIPVHTSEYARSSFDMGDPRKLPYLKDVLKRGLDSLKNPTDGIIWANDDCGLATGIVEWYYGHVEPNGAMSMRRDESGHMGRDLFSFTKEWLERHWDAIPDFLMGCPCFDLVLAALIRKYHGIMSTKDNFITDIWPAESPHRLCLHEPHKSTWAGKFEHTLPGNVYNRKLANEWFQLNMANIYL